MVTKSLLNRFMAKVDKTKTCWLWTGSKVAKGYGKIRTTSNKYDAPECAHRVAYKLFIGDIPYGYLVCHKCDNPSCVNPNHLFLGTYTDNVHDMISKGRRKLGYKLTQPLADKIKVALETTNKSQLELGKEFGVTQSMVWRIHSGLAWRGGQYLSPEDCQ